MSLDLLNRAVDPIGAQIAWMDGDRERAGKVVSFGTWGILVNPEDGPQVTLQDDTPGLQLAGSATPIAATPAESDLPVALTPAEQDALSQHEATIQGGLRSFLAVGTALGDIRDRRLYRATHESFEAYCRDRWNLSRQYAYQQIAAAEVVGNLSAIADTASGDASADTTAALPINEAQTRPLQGLDPDQQRQAWDIATTEAAEAGKPVTAAVVEKAAQQVVDPYCGYQVGDRVGWEERGVALEGAVVKLESGRLIVQGDTHPAGVTTTLKPGDPDLRKLSPVPPAAEVEPETPEVEAEEAEPTVGQAEPSPVAEAAVPEATEALVASEASVHAEPEDARAALSTSEVPAAPAPTAPLAPPIAVPARPNALKSAEEIVAERAGATVPATVGVIAPEAPMVLFPIPADVRDWLSSDDLLPGQFLSRLKDVAYRAGESAAQLLASLEAP